MKLRKLYLMALSAVVLATSVPAGLHAAESITAQTPSDNSKSYVSMDTEGSKTTTATVTVETNGEAVIATKTIDSSTGKTTDASFATESADSTNVSLEKLITTESTVNIPATIAGGDGKTYTVDTIASGALKGSNATKINIPETVKTIEDSAFSDCDNLKNINTKNVTTIGANAFKGCDSLKKATTAATTLEKGAFNGTNLKKLTLAPKTTDVKYEKGSMKALNKKSTKIVVKATSKADANKIVKASKAAGAKKATYKIKIVKK